jgi:hypothetical protein
MRAFHQSKSREQCGARETDTTERTPLNHWEVNWTGTRIHGNTKRQVATMFAEERPRCSRYFLNFLIEREFA